MVQAPVTPSTDAPVEPLPLTPESAAPETPVVERPSVTLPAPPEPEAETPPEAEAAPVKPDYAALLKDLPDEEFDALERVKTVRESERARAARERAEAEQAAVARAEAEKRTQEQAAAFRKQFEDLVLETANSNLDEHGRPTLKPESVDRLFATMRATGAAEGARAGLGAMAYAVLEGIDIEAAFGRLSDAEKTTLKKAVDAFEANPFQPTDLAKFYVDLARREMTSRQKADLRKEVEAEVRAEFEAKAKVTARGAAAEIRRSQPSATPLAGSKPGERSYFTQLEIDQAHVRGEITNAELREMYRDGRYGRLPYSNEG